MNNSNHNDIRFLNNRKSHNDKILSNTPYSEGEILDRLTILEIQNELDTNSLEISNQFITLKNKHILLYKLLYFVNSVILQYNTKDYFKLINRFIESKYRLVSIINSSPSPVIYNKKTINIHIDTENDSVLKSLIYFILNYDTINISLGSKLSSIFILKMKTLFPSCNFYNNHIFDSTAIVDFTTSYGSLLSTYIDNNLINILNPIFYKGDGKLGDFILQLSVINEKYNKTGRKGILYFGNDIPLSCSIEKTYIDSYELIMQQPYIQGYKIWEGEDFDINLSSWRNNYLLYRTSWYDIFKSEYGVEWGKNPWLYVSKTNEYKDKIVIAYTNNTQLDIKGVLSQYDTSNVYLVGYSDENKQDFANNFGYDLQFIKCNTIEDMAIVVNSCKLFIGMMSSPLTLAQGTHHNTVAILNRDASAVHNMLNDYLPSYKYII